MANVKKITHIWNETGLTVYCIIRKDSNSYLLNNADGTFASAPADPYISLTEDATIKGLYELSESRTAWADDDYTVVVYKQVGGSPNLSADTAIGKGKIEIISDTEVVNVSVEKVAGTAQTAGDVTAVAKLIEDILRNKMTVTNATGAVTLYADDSITPLLTTTLQDDSTTTTRLRLT